MVFSGDALGDDPVALGVALGLVVGKTVGVFGGAWLAARFTRAELGPGFGWRDVLGVALLAGVGFTVSLLVADLAFDDDAARRRRPRCSWGRWSPPCWRRWSWAAATARTGRGAPTSAEFPDG